MATRIADRAVLDTNVLLAATDVSRPGHENARAALENWPADGITLYTSGQILREYLSVVTRPREVNGFGMSAGDATANVRELGTRLTLLTEDGRVADRLLLLAETVRCRGRQMHDANIVATMLVHGIGTLVTLNVDDFVRFDDHIEVVDLQS